MSKISEKQSAYLIKYLIARVYVDSLWIEIMNKKITKYQPLATTEYYNKILFIKKIISKFSDIAHYLSH